jgi:lipopolysaccharide export LptBFGC system permease protein LptF
MKLVDRYLGLEWMKWFALSMSFLFAILFLQAFSDDYGFFSKLLEPSGRRDVLVWIVGYMPWVLPISCFVATVSVLGIISKNHELVAMRASGISTFAVSKPLLLLGLLVSFACWFARDYRQQLSSDINQLGKESTLASFGMKIGQSRIWYFQEYDEVSGQGRGVQLYSYDQNGSDSYRIRAKSASWTGNGWSFREGRFLGFPTEKGIPVPQSSGGGIDWEQNPTGFEISKQGRASPRINKRFSVLFLPLAKDDPVPHAALRKKPNSLTYGELVNLLREYPMQQSARLYPYKLRRAQLLWSGPSCLVAVLCGLALGLRRKSTTPGRIAGASLLGMLLFYLAKTFCDALGEKGIASEWLAAGIPYVLISAIAICLVRQSR